MLEVFPEQAGETILTVYDNQDNVDTVRVVVGGNTQTGGETGSGGIVPPTSDASFTSVIYSIAQSEEGSQTINFSINGNPKEIGIIWKENEEIYTQTLEKEESGKYLLACDTCTGESRLYFIDENDQKIYATQNFVSSTQTLQINDFSPIIEISNSAEDSKIIADKYYQLGKNKSINEGYLEGMNQAIYSFLYLDNTQQSLALTDENLKKLASGNIKFSDTIGKNQTFKNIYDTKMFDISLQRNIYSKKEKEWLLGYLATSAYLSQIHTNLSSQRVIDKVNTYHNERQASWVYAARQDVKDNLANLKILAESENSSEYAKGLAKGGYQAIEDYVVDAVTLLSLKEATALATALKNISLNDLKQKGLSAVKDIGELTVIVSNIDEIIAGLPSEEKGFYTGYIGVTIALEILPQTKVIKVAKLVKGGGDSESLKQLKELKSFFDRWKQNQKDAVNRGMILTDHAARHTIGKISLDELEDIYKNGEKFWNPRDSQYIYLKNNKYVAMDPNGTGKIVTVVVNKPTETFLTQLIKQ